MIGGQLMEDVIAAQEKKGKTPHQRAMDRHEAAVATLAGVHERAAEMVRFAEREAAEAMAEVVRYEKQPGVALPVADQRRIEDLTARMRRRMAEHRGE